MYVVWWEKQFNQMRDRLNGGTNPEMQDVPKVHLWKHCIRDDELTTGSKLARDTTQMSYNPGLDRQQPGGHRYNEETGPNDARNDNGSQAWVEKNSNWTQLTAERNVKMAEEDLRLQAMLAEALKRFEKLEKQRYIQNNSGTTYNMGKICAQEKALPWCQTL